MNVRLAIIFSILMIFCLFGFQSALANDLCCEPKSPGYYKNHPDEIPNTLTIGNFTYDKEAIIEGLRSPVRGNKWLTMFKALVAAKLNINKGCVPPPCYCSAIAWWNKYGGTGEIEANSPEWQCPGEYLYECLDDFNNGYWWWDD